MLKKQFQKGQRVRLNRHAAEAGVDERLGRVGTVARQPRENSIRVTVLWDGRKSVSQYHRDFLLRVSGLIAPSHDAALLVRELVSALSHAQVCADCALGSWTTCDGGREALAAMEKATAYLAAPLAAHERRAAEGGE